MSKGRNRNLEDADIDSMLFPESTSKQLTDDEDDLTEARTSVREQTFKSKKLKRDGFDDDEAEEEDKAEQEEGDETEVKKKPKAKNDDEESDADDENNDKDFDLSSSGDEEDDDEDNVDGGIDQTDLKSKEELTKLGKESQLDFHDGIQRARADGGDFSNEPTTSGLGGKQDEAGSSKKMNDEAMNRELVRRRKMEQQEEENKKMQVLMANFSEEQLNRYEIFRRSAFPKASIKKIIQTVCGKTVSASVVIAMSGIAKVFVGEIVEKSLDVKEKLNDSGPLQPKHLREAYRLFKNSNKLSSSVKTKQKNNVLY